VSRVDGQSRHPTFTKQGAGAGRISDFREFLPQQSTRKICGIDGVAEYVLALSPSMQAPAIPTGPIQMMDKDKFR